MFFAHALISKLHEKGEAQLGRRVRDAWGSSMRQQGLSRDHAGHVPCLDHHGTTLCVSYPQALLVAAHVNTYTHSQVMIRATADVKDSFILCSYVNCCSICCQTLHKGTVMSLGVQAEVTAMPCNICMSALVHTSCGSNCSSCLTRKSPQINSNGVQQPSRTRAGDENIQAEDGAHSADNGACFVNGAEASFLSMNPPSDLLRHQHLINLHTLGYEYHSMATSQDGPSFHIPLGGGDVNEAMGDEHLIPIFNEEEGVAAEEPAMPLYGGGEDASAEEPLIPVFIREDEEATEPLMPIFGQDISATALRLFGAGPVLDLSLEAGPVLDLSINPEFSLPPSGFARQMGTLSGNTDLVAGSHPVGTDSHPTQQAPVLDNSTKQMQQQQQQQQASHHGVTPPPSSRKGLSLVSPSGDMPDAPGLQARDRENLLEHSTAEDPPEEVLPREENTSAAAVGQIVPGGGPGPALSLAPPRRSQRMRSGPPQPRRGTDAVDEIPFPVPVTKGPRTMRGATRQRLHQEADVADVLVGMHIKGRKVREGTETPNKSLDADINTAPAILAPLPHGTDKEVSKSGPQSQRAEEVNKADRGAEAEKGDGPRRSSRMKRVRNTTPDHGVEDAEVGAMGMDLLVLAAAGGLGSEGRQGHSASPPAGVTGSAEFPSPESLNVPRVRSAPSTASAVVSRNEVLRRSARRLGVVKGQPGNEAVVAESRVARQDQNQKASNLLTILKYALNHVLTTDYAFL